MKILIVFILFLSSPTFADCFLPDSGKIELLLWNVKEDAGLRNLPVDLVESDADIFMFQESSAYAINGLRDRLPGRETLTIHNSKKFGVASLSKVSPCQAYTIEVDDEPVLPKIDKGIVVQTFKTADGRILKMINVHLPLFIFSMSYGQGGYKKGLQALKKEVENHRGPLIIAGDFYGWTPNRMNDLIPNFVRETGLLEVEFEAEADNRASWLKLDRVFYRGVDPLSDSTNRDLDVSDHYMRELKFAL